MSPSPVGGESSGQGGENLQDSGNEAAGCLDTMGERDREEGDMGGAVEGRATADQVSHPGGI